MTKSYKKISLPVYINFTIHYQILVSLKLGGNHLDPLLSLTTTKRAKTSAVNAVIDSATEKRDNL